MHGQIRMRINTGHTHPHTNSTYSKFGNLYGRWPENIGLKAQPAHGTGHKTLDSYTGNNKSNKNSNFKYKTNNRGGNNRNCVSIKVSIKSMDRQQSTIFHTCTTLIDVCVCAECLRVCVSVLYAPAVAYFCERSPFSVNDRVDRSIFSQHRSSNILPGHHVFLCSV